MSISNNKGQATIEYVLVFVLIGLLSLKMAGRFTKFVGDSFGNMAHVLSIHLMSGTCKNDCFIDDIYKNGSGN